jgi:hypothetical protein
MSTFTGELPPDLASRLAQYTEHIPEILELGLQQFAPTDESTSDVQLDRELGEVVTFLQSSPSPEEILAIRRERQCRIEFAF